MLRFCAYVLRGGLLLGLACLAVAAPWRQIETDLPWDPAWKRGTLQNGIHFAVRNNAVPKGRVSLRLLISVGSLHEVENERGIAHFVEHMVFRGTRRYPGDSLNHALQRKGIGMGPDHTAFTGYDFTIYHIELPDTSEETLRFGLDALREYATAAVFDPAAVNKERGVVRNEKASRDVPELRRAEFNVDFLWPTSRHAQREVIGTDQSLANITREQLIAFYDAWYRPERMALVAVGDADPDSLKRAISEAFSNVSGRGEPRPEPEQLTPVVVSPPNVALLKEPEVVGVELAFQHPVFAPRDQLLKPDRIAMLHRELAFQIFQRRLSRVAADAGDVLVSPTATMETIVPNWETATFTANGRIDSWQKLAAAIEQEHRRAYLFGFTKAELERTRAALKERYDTHVSTAPSRRSENFASEMASSLLHGNVMITPEVLRADVAEALESASLDDCATAFRAAWGRKALHVLVSANSNFPATRAEVAEVLNQSRAVKVERSTLTDLSDFAYQEFGSPGRLTTVQPVPDLDVHLGTFENGLRVNFKNTTFETDVVDACLRISGGRLSAPADKPGLPLLAELAFMNGGLGKHRKSELRELLAARSVYVDFFVDADAFGFRMRSTRKDFLGALQLVAAYLTDAAYRTEALRDASASYNSSISSSLSTAGGVIRLMSDQVILNADNRFSFPNVSEFHSRTMDELRAWMSPFLQDGALELAVVGDIDFAEAQGAVAKTIGALPARKPAVQEFPELQPKFSAPPARPIRIPNRADMKQVAIAWYWPITEEMTIHLERRCYLLAETFQERLWHRLREELGATYSPEVSFVSTDGMPRVSYVCLFVEVDLENAATAADIIKKEIINVGKRGFPEEEFERVKTPILRTRLDDLRENAYWCFTVLRDVQQRPDRLKAARTRHSDTSSIKPGELQKIARRHLTREKGFFFISEPAGSVRIFEGK